jgi:hypothetical protein
MGFIVILPLTWVTIWGTLSIHRWIIRGNFGKNWLRNFWVCGAAGIAIGMVFAFMVDYETRNHLNQIQGFPIPYAMNNREKIEDSWRASEMPAAIRITARFTDLMSGVALSLVPIAIAAFFKENRTPLPGMRPPGTTEGT